MLSRWLRLGLALEMAMIAAVVTGIVRSGQLGAVWAASLAVFIFLGWRGAVVAATFALARLHGRRTGSKTGFVRALLSFAIEWASYTLLFAAIQPFDRFWMRSERLGELQPGRIPTLLVHGYFCNRGSWWWIYRSLRARRLAVATVSLEPPFADIDALAEQLAGRIEALLDETRTGRVNLVGHSMGGLVCRAYVRRFGWTKVATLLTFGTPHRGTWLAFLGLGENARQMRPGSEWLTKLAAAEPKGSDLTVWSTIDNFIMPPESSHLPSAREIVLTDLGHLSMLLSPAILDVLICEIGASSGPAPQR